MFGSSLLSFQMSPVLAALCAWRAVWAVLSHAYYVPDESWQSVEVAHGLVWPGQGLLTWEAEAGLRSSLQSLPFVAVFRLLALLGLDTQVLLRLLFRIYFCRFRVTLLTLCTVCVYK